MVLTESSRTCQLNAEARSRTSQKTQPLLINMNKKELKIVNNFNELPEGIRNKVIKALSDDILERYDHPEYHDVDVVDNVLQDNGYKWELMNKKNKKYILNREKKQREMPIGVSQWKAMGKKYGYWKYFEKKQRDEIVEIVKNENLSIP